MVIKKLKISNFKSFDELEIELGRFNVLIGANASGKSNFTQIFRFIRDIISQGLNNAISLQGGIKYFRNINIGSAKNFSLEIVSDEKYGNGIRGKDKKGYFLKTFETAYKLALEFKKKGEKFRIAEDVLNQKFEIFEMGFNEENFKEKGKVGDGELFISNVGRNLKVEFNLPNGIVIDENFILPPFIKERGLKSFQILLEITPFLMVPPFFKDILICDFDPKFPKKAAPISGKAEIEEDGSNLAIVLKNILENKDKKRKLFNLLKDLLPFIDDIDVEKFADKTLLFKLREVYSTKNRYIPASLISDGTIHLTALILALYFEKNSLTIIEEPERNIHPYLISKVVDMMKDASRKKQIIVTTHNPEIVKYAGLENILLISRNNEGFSVISKPIEKEQVKIFLQNELGIDDLYVQNLLEL